MYAMQAVKEIQIPLDEKHHKTFADIIEKTI